MGEIRKQKNRKRFIFKGLRFCFVRMKGLHWFQYSICNKPINMASPQQIQL